MKELHLIVKGKVQGVFFRRYAKETAKTLGIFGWAWNTEEGHVEILVQGEEDILKKYTDEIRKGSPSSQVDEVEETWREVGEQHSDFVTH